MSINNSLANAILSDNYAAAVKYIEAGADVGRAFPDEIRMYDALETADYVTLKLLLKNGLNIPDQLTVPNEYPYDLDTDYYETTYKKKREKVIDRLTEAQKGVQEERAPRYQHVFESIPQLPSALTQIIHDYDIPIEKDPRDRQINEALSIMPKEITKRIAEYDEIPSHEELDEERNNVKSSVFEIVKTAFGIEDRTSEELGDIPVILFNCLRF